MFTVNVVQYCTILYNFAYCDRINRLCHIAYYIVQLLCTFPAQLYRAPSSPNRRPPYTCRGAPPDTREAMDAGASWAARARQALDKAIATSSGGQSDTGITGASSAGEAALAAAEFARMLLWPSPLMPAERAKVLASNARKNVPKCSQSATYKSTYIRSSHTNLHTFAAHIQIYIHPKLTHKSTYKARCTSWGRTKGRTLPNSRETDREIDATPMCVLGGLG